MQLSLVTLLVAAVALPLQTLAFVPTSLPLRHGGAPATGAKISHGVLPQPPVARARTSGSALGLNMGDKQTFKNFDDMIENSEKPLLVDFYAVWCGPCVLMGRELSQLSETLKDEISVVKIDTEKYPKITNRSNPHSLPCKKSVPKVLTQDLDRFDVYALPTCILFKDGEPIERIEGVMKHDQLKELVESKLK